MQEDGIRSRGNRGKLNFNVTKLAFCPLYVSGSYKFVYIAASNPSLLSSWKVGESWENVGRKSPGAPRRLEPSLSTRRPRDVTSERTNDANCERASERASIDKWTRATRGALSIVPRRIRIGGEAATAARHASRSVLIVAFASPIVTVHPSQSCRIAH